MKWEYKFLHVAGRVGQIPYNGPYIQELGQDGWELISVDNGVAYFKRPIYPAMDYQKWIEDNVKAGINEDS